MRMLNQYPTIRMPAATTPTPLAAGASHDAARAYPQTAPKIIPAIVDKTITSDT